MVADVREALAGLGYGDHEIRDTLRDWRIGRTRRVSVGFYVSQGLELERACDG